MFTNHSNNVTASHDDFYPRRDNCRQHTISLRHTIACSTRITGTADHVHVLARIRPAHSPTEIARVIKTNSSRWLDEKGQPEFAWQAGYGAFSVSDSNVEAVIRYIADQEAHHQRHSFQDEFLAFLKKNNVAYDPGYIWD
jgi:putative transposase